jgi:hypothetical protein
MIQSRQFQIAVRQGDNSVSNTNVDYAVSNATATLSLMSLRSFAEMKFANKVALALQDYAKANNGQFPSDFSQLAGLCDQNLIPILTDTYRIAPASTVQNMPMRHMPGMEIKPPQIQGDWIIIRKKPTKPFDVSVAIFPGGTAFFNFPEDAPAGP